MLQLIEIGIVFKNVANNDCRNIVLKDENNQWTCEYMLVKKQQPYLWKTIEKTEKSGLQNNKLNGRIEEFNGFRIVVFDGEDQATAFERQKSGLKEKKVLTIKEACEKAKNSQGYKTDNEKEGVMIPGWIPLEQNLKKIKFRYYHNAGKQYSKKTPHFEWTDWFGIKKN